MIKYARYYHSDAPGRAFVVYGWMTWPSCCVWLVPQLGFDCD